MAEVLGVRGGFREADRIDGVVHLSERGVTYCDRPAIRVEQVEAGATCAECQHLAWFEDHEELQQAHLGFHEAGRRGTPRARSLRHIECHRRNRDSGRQE